MPEVLRLRISFAEESLLRSQRCIYMGEFLGMQSGDWATDATPAARQEVEKMISTAVAHLFVSIGEGLVVRAVCCRHKT